MANIDNQHWINEIEYHGETVTVTTVTDDSYSKWGDASESTSDEASIKAMVNDLTPQEQKEMEGIFPNVERRFFFKPDQSNLAEGNRITHNSIDYEMVRVIEHNAAGSTFVIEVWGNKT